MSIAFLNFFLKIFINKSLIAIEKFYEIVYYIDNYMYLKEKSPMNDIKYTKTENRIDIYTYATDKFKSENISIYFAVPTVREESVKRSLLLSVLKRGTEKYPTQREINERLDELYATLVNLKNQKFDDIQLLGVSADIIYSSYTEHGEDLMPDALEVVEQMLYHPRFDENTGMFFEEFVKSEKENYKSIILSQINEPRTYAAIRCREETFSSLGIVDSLDTMCERIDSVTAVELYKCYQNIVDNAKLVVFYVGKRTPDEIRELVSKVFVKNGIQTLENKSSVKLLSNLESPNEITEMSELSQGRLIMGFNCGVTWSDVDYYPMLLCNEIFGASPVSKLFMNVREKLSLCYECSSIYNSARGVIFATTGIDSDSYETAKAAIVEQLRDIQNGEISEKEFNAAKKSIFNVYSSLCDSPNAIERFYLGRIVNSIDVDVADFLKIIENLTVQDVIRVSQKLTLHTVYFLRGEGEEIYE